MKSMNEEQFNSILGLYSKKGYHIIKGHEVEDEMPPFLSSLNYFPDYIIRSESANYVVEMSSSKNFNDEKRLEKIIDEVEKNREWEFILVEVDIKSKDEESGHHIESQDEKSDHPIESKDKKSDHHIKSKDEKSDHHIESKGEKPKPQIKSKDDKPVQNIEQKDEKGTHDSAPEDEKPGTSFESITKGYLNLKLMLENKQFESHPESVLLYGWVLLESMIRKLFEKEQTGVDIGFLLNEAVTDDIIDNSEISELKKVYLLRSRLVRGEFGIVTEKSRLEPLIKVINKLYDKYYF